MYLAINRAKYLLLLICLGFASICHAIGFGELKLYSYLGEPLYAEIALTGYADMDTNLLQVNLASAKDFMRAGIERPYFLTSLAFQTATYDNKLYVVVRTAKPVQIPYVEFLIELAWPGGNLIKEYTILLDPPPADLQNDRPKGAGQIAEARAAQQTATVNPIEQQMDLQKAKQQRQLAEGQLTDVVRDGPNKFSDNTFDVDLPQTKAAEAAALVPGVVPEVPENSAEYEKQRQEFEEAKATKVKPVPSTLLQKVVNDVSDFQRADAQSEISIKSILAEENAAQAASTPAAPAPSKSTPTAANAEEPIDFNEVIKPVKKKVVVDEAPVPTVQSSPPPTEEKGNYVYLGIILSLLLIAVGVVIAIKRGLLSSILHKQSSADPTAATESQNVVNEVPVSEHLDENKLAEAIDQFTANDEDAEEIEMSSAQNSVQAPVDEQPTPKTEPIPTPEIEPVPIEPASPVKAPTLPATDFDVEPDLDSFEEEFGSIDLDALGVPPEPPVETAIEPSVEPTIQMDQLVPPPEQAAPDTLSVPDAEPVVEPKATFNLVEDDVIAPTQVATPASDAQVTGPTLAQDNGSGLKLSEEGASLVSESAHIIDNSDAVAMKIKLAKQYIETGDKESAKELLHEVLEIANDDQKLEAKLLLTSLE